MTALCSVFYSLSIELDLAGLLILNAALLYCARDAIRSNKPTALSEAIKFLHGEYEPHVFWWELVEMLRRFLLVGLMVLFQDTMMQLVVGTFLAAAFLLFQVQASPFVNMSDDLLASSLSFCVVVCFLCCYAFKDAALTGLEAIQDKMSIEQKDLYVLDQDTLTVVMMCVVIAALVISAVIFAFQLAAEAARAKQVRRLLHNKTNEQVNISQHYMKGSRQLQALINSGLYRAGATGTAAPRAGPFHVFLSHNWKHGQAEMRIVKERLREMLPGASVFLGAPLVRRTRPSLPHSRIPHVSIR